MEQRQPGGMSELPLTAVLAVTLMMGFTLVGLLLDGVPSFATARRILDDFGNRTEGPLHFRFILQPIMAGLAAAKDGYQDAATGQRAFGLTVLTDPEKRRGRLREALVSTSTVILVALAMDAIYQVLVDQTFRPFESVLVALLLGFLPYVLLRGPFGRIAGWWTRGDKDPNK